MNEIKIVFITKLIYRRNLRPLREMLLWNNNLCVTTSKSGMKLLKWDQAQYEDRAGVNFFKTIQYQDRAGMFFKT
jgi:hypothetical protein